MMVVSTSQTPEPKQPTEKVVEKIVSNLPSSEEESEDEIEINNYQPLPTNDFELDLMISSEEEDAEEGTDEDDEKDSTKRELDLDPNLILNTMQKITLKETSIPSWAKDLSDAKWNEIVKKVQKS